MTYEEAIEKKKTTKSPYIKDTLEYWVYVAPKNPKYLDAYRALALNKVQFLRDEDAKLVCHDGDYTLFGVSYLMGVSTVDYTLMD